MHDVVHGHRRGGAQGEPHGRGERATSSTKKGEKYDLTLQGWQKDGP